MNIHTVTLPDGTTAKRESLTRRYGFVVIAERSSYNYESCEYGIDPWVWDALAWSATERNAEGVAAQKRKYPKNYRNVRVIPATMTEHTPKPRKVK